MSSNSGPAKLTPQWKTPNEILKMQRLKQKKKALQARFERDLNDEDKKVDKSPLEVVFSQKRKNPFSKDDTNEEKKAKFANSPNLDSEDSLFQLIKNSENIGVSKSTNSLVNQYDQNRSSRGLSELFQNYAGTPEIEEELTASQHLPIDWGIKVRLRILSKKPLPCTGLKTSQEASGLTSFVRCIDTQKSETTLDISLGARFHQNTHYWQHPHISWLTLFPRNSRANNGIQLGEIERSILMKEWTDSFRGLFQLLRARQCPYFYVCANTFTVLFRAAGIGGCTENHAMLSPTSRGLRSSLKKETIEFTQPLKSDSALNKSSENNDSLTNASEDASVNTSNGEIANVDDDGEDDDDLEEEKWLQSLGVDDKEIKKISSVQARQTLHKEMAEDFSDSSLVLIEGDNCQALFNFLLNAKSTIPAAGRLAGIPPTLLAPVAFPGATMRSLQLRSTKIRMESEDYFSVELKGVILPHVLPYICNLLSESCDSFSATIVSNMNTLAFTKASQKLILNSKKDDAASNHVFGKENLSECGLQPKIVESMCRVDTNATCLMERMCYNIELGGYTWS